MKQQVSKSAQLQQAILQVAARDSAGLDFSRTARTKTFYGTFPERAFSEGQQVLLVGYTDTHTLSLVLQRTGSQGLVHLLEEDETLLAQVREQASQLEAFPHWQLLQGPLDDLSTDSTFVNAYLATHSLTDILSYRPFQEALEEQRRNQPWMPSGSIECVVVDQTLNRLPLERIPTLLREAQRVLRPDGHLMLRLLLADEPAPATLPAFPDGKVVRTIPQESAIFSLLAETGYYGMHILWRADLPVKVTQGVELRVFLVEAYKAEQAIQRDRGHAIMYCGPWREVTDDTGRSYRRGERSAVSEARYHTLQQAPYQQDMLSIPPYLEVPVEQAPSFGEQTPLLRDPAVTKGRKTVFDESASCCSPSQGTCY